MDYPIEILPNIDYKIIDCDLSNYFLIRHIDISPEENILDPETNIIYKKYICPQSDHIEDLSTSLLGVFKRGYIHIAFTQEGSTKFFQYCEPNIIVDIPVYETDFFNKENRKFWCVLINNLNNKEFKYNVGPDELTAICSVIHTPTKWNYWHFSLKWSTTAGPLEGLEDKKRKSIAKKIGHSAIVAICQFAIVEIPQHTNLDEQCYRIN